MAEARHATDPYGLEQTPDGQLLARFLSARCERAFAALVQRHAPQVYGVCLRALGEQSAAEDAVQATFLLLMRKANSLRADANLAGWLHVAARHCAHEVRRAALRRLKHEQKAAAMAYPATAGRQVGWEDLKPEVDDALAKLPQVQREAVLLRHFYGYSEAEAAQRLGCQERTLHMRVGRGVARLREHFSRRGMDLSEVSLLALLAQHSPVTLAPAFSASLVSVCVGKNTASAMALSACQAAAQCLLLQQLKLVAGAIVLLAAIVAGSFYTLSARPALPAGVDTSGTLPAQILPDPKPEGRQFYVSPDAQNGDGSPARPWDLASALAKSEIIAPGDTLWLRAGRYGDGQTVFTSKLNGSREKPITIRQARDERVTIDGGIRVEGNFNRFWGFEITSSATDSPNRRLNRPLGLDVSGRVRGTQAINLVIHNSGECGISLPNQGDGAQIYGCLLYANGNYADATATPPQTRGCGMNLQNDNGTVTVAECIVAHNLGEGIYAYGTRGRVQGLDITGNICVANDHEDLAFATVPGGNQANPVDRLSLLENFTWQNLHSALRRGGVRCGYKGDHGQMSIRRNYFVAAVRGSTPVLMARKFMTQTVSENTLIGPELLVFNQEGDFEQKSLWNSNTYFGGNTQPFHYVSIRTQRDHKGSLAEWQASGADADSACNPGFPGGTLVFVRPNKLERGRGHVIVYNWALAQSVELELSGVLREGDAYEIRDAQNFFGSPVLRGRYDKRPISLPLTRGELLPVLGAAPTYQLRHSGPQFGVFVVLAQPGSER